MITIFPNQFIILQNFHFRPNEDDQDLHSDEESFISSHASDIGSPAPSIVPSTPSSNHYENVFKKPLPIESNQEDLIVHRTRSKLPLTNTSLELLEMAFVPPDITTDMYDSDCNNDPEWKRFLWVRGLNHLPFHGNGSFCKVGLELKILCLGVCMPANAAAGRRGDRSRVQHP